jgi:predicted tellurium resistance membrane protein TerC
MREKQLRVIIGIGLVAGHLITILTILGLYTLGGFAFDEMTTAVGLVSPMFVAYTSVIASYFARHRFRSASLGKIIEPAFVAMTMAAPALFIFVVLGATMMKAFNIAFASFDEYKTTILGIETVFGVYLGRFMPILFESKSQPQQRETQGEPERKQQEIPQ